MPRVGDGKSEGFLNSATPMLENTFRKYQYADIEYYAHSSLKSPKKLLVVSGLHGDESGVIEPLFHFFDSCSEIPYSIVFIPEAYPSAVRRKKRNNVHERNGNRLFGTDIQDPEKDMVEKIVTTHAPYDLVVSFHEDTQYPQTYVYDVGQRKIEPFWDNWRKAMHTIGIELLNGVDDSDDPALRYVFVNGYHYTLTPKNSGQFEDWVVMNNFTERSLTIEIPAFVPSEKKKDLIYLYFMELIFPLSGI